MMEITVKNGVLTLEQAFALLSGEAQADSLTPEQKALVIAADGETSRIVLEKGGEYTLGDKTVCVTKPCVLEGNGAKVSGNAPISLIVGASDVTFRDVVFEKHNVAVVINPSGITVEHIHFSECVFAQIETSAVVSGSDKSNGIIRDIAFNGCTFIGREGTETFAGGDGVWFLNMSPILSDDSCDIDNCLLDGVTMTNCRAYGGHRIFANLLCRFMLTDNLGVTKHKFHNNEVRNVKFLRNDFSDCMDPYVNIIAAPSGCHDCSVHDVEVAHNTMKVGLWAVYVTGCEPMNGVAVGGKAYDISIHDNDISVYEGGVGEASMGVSVQTGRIDYFGNTHALDGTVERVSVCNNTFRGMTRGVLINATCALFDAPDNIIENCVGRDILIEGNKFYDVEEVFAIWASNHEGRRVDWNIGVPPHEVVWGELLEDKDILTVQTRNNRLENVVIRNNFASGYRFKYKICGVRALGQGIATDNVCQVTLENNHFEHGEGHYLIADFDACDNVHDGGGNKVIVSGKI